MKIPKNDAFIFWTALLTIAFAICVTKIFLFPTVANGAEVQWAPNIASLSDRPTITYRDTVVRVEVPINNNSSWAGTGTLIWKDGIDGLVVTCAHVASKHNVTAIFSPTLNSHKSHSKVCYRSSANDFAMFFVKLPQKRARVFPVMKPLCKHFLLRRGARMGVFGFGNIENHRKPLRSWLHRLFHRKNLKLSGYTQKLRKNKRLSVETYTDIELTSSSSAPGDSGGPIYTSISGKPYFAGVNWGYDDYDHHTKGVAYTKVYQAITETGFLRKVFQGKGGGDCAGFY